MEVQMEAHAVVVPKRDVRARKRRRGLSPKQIADVRPPPRKRYWQYMSPDGWEDYPRETSDFLNNKTMMNGVAEYEILVYPTREADVEVDLLHYVQWEYDEDYPAGKGRSIRMVVE